MGLGLLTGRNEAGAPVDENYALVGRLIKQFKEKFGSINCKELIGVDLGTQEGQIEFREKNLFAHCLNYAEEATRMVIFLTDLED